MGEAANHAWAPIARLGRHTADDTVMWLGHAASYVLAPVRNANLGGMREGALDSVTAVARLLRERNEIDGEITRIINRPAVAGHLGEWLASQLFDIDLEPPDSAEAFDGRFASGPLATRTVNIEWISKRDEDLVLTSSRPVDFHLVFTGPKALALTIRGIARPVKINGCYLFEARGREARQATRGAASSLLAEQWDAAEIFPGGNNPLLAIGPEARGLLALFGG
jgi:hypothetical protein